MDGAPTLDWGRTLAPVSWRRALAAAGVALVLTYTVATALAYGAATATLSVVRTGESDALGDGIFALFVGSVTLLVVVAVGGPLLVKAAARRVAHRRMSFVAAVATILASGLASIGGAVAADLFGEVPSGVATVELIATLAVTVFAGAWVIRRCAGPLRTAAST